MSVEDVFIICLYISLRFINTCPKLNHTETCYFRHNQLTSASCWNKILCENTTTVYMYTNIHLGSIFFFFIFHIVIFLLFSWFYCSASGLRDVASEDGISISTKTNNTLTVCCFCIWKLILIEHKLPPGNYLFCWLNISKYAGIYKHRCLQLVKYHLCVGVVFVFVSLRERT